jgi:hypothetical protein
MMVAASPGRTINRKSSNSPNVHETVALASTLSPILNGNILSDAIECTAVDWLDRLRSQKHCGRDTINTTWRDSKIPSVGSSTAFVECPVVAQ